MTTATSPQNAISTSHHLATEAGAAALRAGGNAVDAALAAAATLCVVYPNNVALGGDLVALVRNPDGEVRFLNATGPTPKGQTLDALRKAHGAELPLRGIDTVTVPGGVCGWNSLHEYGASRNWDQHFEAAIRHASEGFPNSRSVAAALIEDRESLENDPGAAAVFYPGGRAIAEGETLKQPALAASLRELASGGSAAFYTGELAERWIAGLAKLGSKITMQDADDYSAEWGEPIETGFQDVRVLTSPPNTSGFMLLRALRAISGDDGGPGIDDPLGTGAGALAQAFADANSVRIASLADPRLGGIGANELLTATVTGSATVASGNPTGDTVGLSAVSADGWAISLINSVYWGFGAHILDPDTGIIFQNRGTSFSLDSAHPNTWVPGKRPRHTLMPVLVLRGNDLAWVPATMGGAAQPQIHTQLLVHSLNGSTPREATHAPRWVVEERRAGSPPSVTAERDVPQETLLALQEAGFSVNIVPEHSEDLGHSNLIRITDGNTDASSDPRSDGSAIVL